MRTDRGAEVRRNRGMAAYLRYRCSKLIGAGWGPGGQEPLQEEKPSVSSLVAGPEFGLAWEGLGMERVFPSCSLPCVCLRC